jgi:U3 small nucleolar RNA-associated protein 19
MQTKPTAPKNAPTGSEPDSDNDLDATEDDWRNFFDDEKQKKPSASEPSTRLRRLTVHRSLHSLASHRAVFTRLWLRLLPRLSGNNDAGSALSLRVLNVMHRGVMPHLTRAVMVMDWVSGCVDYGRCCDIFSFFPQLMKSSRGCRWLARTQHSIHSHARIQFVSRQASPLLVGSHSAPHDRDYPSFYTRLYAFLDQDLLHLKYRSRFFRLAELFLSSTSAHLLTAFL